MEIKIPAKFDLVDSTIMVEKGQVATAIGFSDYHNNKIIIDPSVSKDLENAIFFHEIVHWILFKMCNKLEADEKFVGLFGNLLHQAMKSMEYNNE